MQLQSKLFELEGHGFEFCHIQKISLDSDFWSIHSQKKIIKCLQLRKCFWIKTKILLLHKVRRYFYVINIKKFVIV